MLHSHHAKTPHKHRLKYRLLKTLTQWLGSQSQPIRHHNKSKLLVAILTLGHKNIITIILAFQYMETLNSF